MEENWRLKPNEKWNQMFRHKSRDAPILSTKSKACLKFYVKGFCFDDCNLKNSHVKLEGEDFNKTDKYIKSWRS